MSVREVAAGEGVRRLVTVAALGALALGAAACPRHAEPSPPPLVVADAAPALPPVRDAAVDRPADGPRDAPPDTAGPPRGHGHRAAAASRVPAGGGFKVEGSITRADAETVLRGARGKLEACYQTERAKDPALAGRVSFRLSIDGRGRVPLAEVVASTLGGGDPELCMVEALRDLKFPPSTTGAESTLTFPMAFGR